MATNFPLTQHVEALIFAAQSPVKIEEIKQCLETILETKISKSEIEATIKQLQTSYTDERFSFEVIAIGGGYQFLTKGAYHPTIGTLLKQKSKKRLSRAALETLSIIAYKQPVNRTEIEQIRGVNCDYSLQKLLEKELIQIAGRSTSPGRPLLYGTSAKFMDYFGLKSMSDLPKLKDFKTPENAIGEQPAVEEQ